MEFIQQVERAIRRFDPPPIYSPAIQSERDALEAEIERDQMTLENLRQKEAELRAELVGELRHLHFNIEVAAHRIETRQWADGNCCLDTDFEHVIEARDILAECVDEITYTENTILEKQNDLDDSALWQEEND